MKLTSQLKKRIVDFILEIQSNKSSLSHELREIFYGYPITQQFDSERRNFRQFAEHVVDETLRYGRLENLQPDENIDNHSLIVLLRSLTKRLGTDRQTNAESLILNINERCA